MSRKLSRTPRLGWRLRIAAVAAVGGAALFAMSGLASANAVSCGNIPTTGITVWCENGVTQPTVAARRVTGSGHYYFRIGDTYNGSILETTGPWYDALWHATANPGSNVALGILVGSGPGVFYVNGY